VIFGLRGAVLSLLLASASFAPFQCASEADPNKRREEEPGEALYGLAEQFKAKGEQVARADTLRYLIKKYPTSRFAERARLDLSEAETGQ
jgi:outer membrane protein assembly factor BamD (BamD/ComL family)